MKGCLLTLLIIFFVVMPILVLLSEYILYLGGY